MKLSPVQYMQLRLSIVVIAFFGLLVFIHWPRPSTVLTQEGVQIEAKGVTTTDDENGVSLTRTCNCEGKQNATLINLTDAPTARTVQRLDTDGKVLAEWNITLPPSEVHTLRLQKQGNGSLRIKKKTTDIVPAS